MGRTQVLKTEKIQQSVTLYFKNTSNLPLMAEYMSIFHFLCEHKNAILWATLLCVLILCKIKSNKCYYCTV